MTAPLARVLCVDDEPLLLEGLERTLGGVFEVHTASSGEEALRSVQPGADFAAVISDMRMPGMDGATLLTEFARRSPDTSRVLLTGHADVAAAMRAVNEGQIFRFLTKPCAPEVLLTVMIQATEHHRLLHAEKELLERTLSGAVNVLTDVLGLTSPLLFSRTASVRRIVRVLCDRLKLPNPWKLDMAAMLSRLGCVAVPGETLERHFSGQLLNLTEQRTLDEHPEVAWRLLSRIPRMEDVAEIIRRQKGTHSEAASPEVATGAAVLRLALSFDRRLLLGETVLMALHQLSKWTPPHPPELLDLLRDFEPMSVGAIVRPVKLGQLVPGMVLDQDVRSGNGSVLVSKGYEVTLALIERLRRFAEGVGVEQPIRVQCHA